jgi:two-component system, OmpR family, response regulator
VADVSSPIEVQPETRSVYLSISADELPLRPAAYGSAPRILICEPDADIANLLIPMLEVFNFDTCWVRDGLRFLELAAIEDFAALIIERDLPGTDGISCLRTLQEQRSRPPILLTATSGNAADRVRGLIAGADDYLVKPYCLIELCCRLSVLVNRRAAPQPAATTLCHADLEVDLICRNARRGKKQIPLSQREFRLLEYLVRNPGKLINRAELLQMVWDLPFDPGSNVVDVHICKLRAKIDGPNLPSLLKTIRGHGYMLGDQ